MPVAVKSTDGKWKVVNWIDSKVRGTATDMPCDLRGCSHFIERRSSAMRTRTTRRFCPNSKRMSIALGPAWFSTGSIMHLWTDLRIVKGMSWSRHGICPPSTCYHREKWSPRRSRSSSSVRCPLVRTATDRVDDDGQSTRRPTRLIVVATGLLNLKSNPLRSGLVCVD